jgi:hypothetical protein
MVSKMSSERMSETNKRMGPRISEWMKARKVSDETRLKISRSLRGINHRPVVIGGNGRGPTEAQKKLALEFGFKMEHAIATAGCGVQCVPNCYKVDLACLETMLAIEVDGSSHNSGLVKERDAKKGKALSNLGWTVLRFSNKEILGGESKWRETISFTISRLKETKTSL